MKIVHIITRLILGGAQENTLITCKLLAERGHNVTLITGPAIGPEGQLFEQSQNQGFNIITVDEMIRSIALYKDLIAYCKIKKLLRELKPDIVHTHSAKAGILGRFAASGIEIDTKIVHTIHGLAFHEYQSKWLNRFYIAIEKAAAKKTDFFISVAEAMTEQALAAGIGSPEKFITAYSAIEEDDFLQPKPEQLKKDFRRKYKIDQDAVVLITVARLFKLKGHKYIIASAERLAKQFEKAVWLFVGDGNLSGKLKEEVYQLGLAEKIKFTGLLSPDEIPLAISSSDVLVHCSLREGLARALPQAMLSAKPVVSFDTDGAKEVVNENTGRLVKPKNIEQLINSCAELLENEQLREELGLAGREFVKEKFAPAKMVDTIEGVYKKLLEEKAL
ncbi:MAG: glycosyltransferase family 4 protein [Planctomycetes bacterium]|nr:glycosyltransferase family 4 protein [Planctomycetota bacterium]